MIGFRGTADLMLVIKVDAEGEWEEIYYGDFSDVLKHARYSKRDNKHTLTISKLRQLAEEGAGRITLDQNRS